MPKSNADILEELLLKLQKQSNKFEKCKVSNEEKQKVLEKERDSLKPYLELKPIKEKMEKQIEKCKNNIEKSLNNKMQVDEEIKLLNQKKDFIK